MFFEKPTQVLVKEDQSRTYGAIAYKDEIIFGDNGQVVKIDNPYIEIVETYSWIEISDAIIGN